ncbi:MAG: hypothetical protein ACJ0KI_09170 [Dehalococcoidia bacterium]
MKSVAAINLEIGKDLVVDEIEIPDPRPDQVIVKLISSGGLPFSTSSNSPT